VGNAAAFSVCRPQENASEKGRGAFIDAHLTSDGRLGVFTFNRVVPLPPEYGGSPLIFSPPPKKLVVGPITDRIYVGSYALETGLIRILWMKENREWLPGSYKFYIDSVSGAKALIRGYGQPRVPYQWTEDYYLLDVKSGDFRQLPILRELAQRRLGLHHEYLVDSDGTILFETTPPDQPVPLNTDPPVDLWLRFPSGEYFLLDRRSHFFRNKSIDGLVYYSHSYSFPAPPQEGLKVYAVKQRISQEVEYRTVSERKYADIELSADLNGNLVVGRKVKGPRTEKWVYEVRKVSTEVLK
jgi:hypothetical protein